MNRLTWTALYWLAGEAVTFDSDHTRWGALPQDGLLRVRVRRDEYTHTLAGFDNYWLHGISFGVFNDPENLAWYGGNPDAQAFAFSWPEEREIVIPAHAPPGAHVVRGVLVPDEVAWELGLMPAGERLQPRPE